MDNETAQTSVQYSVKEIDGGSSGAIDTEKRQLEGGTPPGVTRSINIGRFKEEKPDARAVAAVTRKKDPAPSTPDSALIESPLKEKLYQENLRTSNELSEGDFVAQPRTSVLFHNTIAAKQVHAANKPSAQDADGDLKEASIEYSSQENDKNAVDPRAATAPIYRDLRAPRDHSSLVVRGRKGTSVAGADNRRKKDGAGEKEVLKQRPGVDPGSIPQQRMARTGHPTGGQAQEPAKSERKTIINISNIVTSPRGTKKKKEQAVPLDHEQNQELKKDEEERTA